MAVDISINLENSDKIDLFLKKMPENFRFALKEAINKTAQQIRKGLIKEVPKEFGFDKELAKEGKLIKATQSIVDAMVMMRGKRTPFWAFGNVTPRGIMKGMTSGGVTVNIMGKARHYPHAFISNMGRKNIGVYERIEDKWIRTKDGRKRQATGFLTAGPVAKMAQSPKSAIPENTQSMAQIEFEKNFRHECEVLLRGAGHIK